MFSHLVRMVTGKYKEEEIRQIEAAKKYYKTFVSDELPEELNLGQNNEERKNLSHSSYDNVNWQCTTQGELGKEFFHIITLACRYQYSRRFHREHGNGYDDDPINLILHHLKVWAFKLSSAQPSHELILEINKMSQYIKALYFDEENLFPKSFSRTLTMRQTLLEIDDYLNEVVMIRISNELIQQSALEKMALLLINLKAFFESSVYFLCYVFRNEQRDNVSLDLLKNLSKKTEDYSLYLLIELLQSGAFVDPLCIESAQLEPISDNRPSENNAMTMSTALLRENKFLVAQSRAHYLHTYLMLDKKTTGIASAFKNNECVITYIKSCGNLYEIGKFFVVLTLAKKCARAGGDILLYGLCREIFEDHLKGLKEWLQRTLALLGSLKKKADEEYRRQIAETESLNEKVFKTEGQHWRDNYRKASKFHVHLQQACEASLTYIREMIAAANSMSIDERIEQALETTRQYYQMAFEHSNQIRRMLGKATAMKPVNFPVLLEGPGDKRRNMASTFHSESLRFFHQPEVQRKPELTLARINERIKKRNYQGAFRLLQKIGNQVLNLKQEQEMLSYKSAILFNLSKFDEARVAVEVLLGKINLSHDPLLYYATLLKKGLIFKGLKNFGVAKECLNKVLLGTQDEEIRAQALLSLDELSEDIPSHIKKLKFKKQQISLERQQHDTSADNFDKISRCSNIPAHVREDADKEKKKETTTAQRLREQEGNIQHEIDEIKPLLGPREEESPINSSPSFDCCTLQ